MWILFFFVCFLYNACVGTVPILCRVKFRACLAYIMYVSIPCIVRAESIPALPICYVRVNSVHCACCVNSGPSWLAACFEVFLCPSCHPKTWGRCRGSYNMQLCTPVSYHIKPYCNPVMEVRRPLVDVLYNVHYCTPLLEYR